MIASVLLFLFWTLLFSAAFLGGLWLLYRSRFGGAQRWLEAVRHQYTLEMIIGRWIWFRWIHLDCQYWIVHVDFSKGPIELLGQPPEGSYWSFTYNTWTEVNPSVNSENVALTPEGGYRIHLTKDDRGDKNQILVRPDARLGVIYFRIYEPPRAFPTVLPEVRQNGITLARGSLS